MIYEYISIGIGIIKLILYKIIYPNRIIYKKNPKLNHTFKFSIKKMSKLIIGSNFRTRNNISIRIYNKGTVSIGNNCFFNDNCSINSQGNITIGNNVIFGQNVMIFDHDHDYKNDVNNFIIKDVKIGNNVWIGANCVILKGVNIGNNVTIAAGTIVNKDIESNCMCYQERINHKVKVK